MSVVDRVLNNTNGLRDWINTTLYETNEVKVTKELLDMITPAKIIKLEERTLSPNEQRLFDMITEKINQD